MGKYYIDKDKIIYRQLASDNTKAVCMVPPDIHKVVPVSELKHINKHQAKESINKAWDFHQDEWVYNGKTFRADKTLLQLGDIYKPDDKSYWEFKGEYGQHESPCYSLINKGEFLKDKDGNVVKEHFWVGQFQGKIIVYNPYHYCPQAFAWEFKEDNLYWKGRTIGFIPMKHIKPIYNMTDAKWL